MAAKLVFAAAQLAVVSVASSTDESAPQQFMGKAISLMSTSLGDPKGMGPKELDGMEGAIEALVTKGDDKVTRMAVQQMSDFIVKTLLPNRERTLALEKKQLKASFEALEQCELKHAVKNDMNLHEKVATSMKHRDNYRKHMADHGTCLQMSSTKALLRDSRCAKVKDFEKLCKEYEHPKQNMVEKVISPQDTTVKECCDAHGAYQAHLPTCVNSKTEADYYERQREIVMTSVCDDYSECHTKKLKIFSNVEKSMKASDKRREWQTLYTIKCLVDAFKDGKVPKQEAKACKDKKYKTHDVEFPVAPVKAQCEASKALLQDPDAEEGDAPPWREDAADQVNELESENADDQVEKMDLADQFGADENQFDTESLLQDPDAEEGDAPPWREDAADQVNELESENADDQVEKMDLADQFGADENQFDTES